MASLQKLPWTWLSLDVSIMLGVRLLHQLSTNQLSNSDSSNAINSEKGKYLNWSLGQNVFLHI